MATNFIKARLDNMDYYFMFYLASGTIASVQIARYAYESFRQKRKHASQELMYKTIVEKKQSSRSSSLQEITLQNKMQGYSKDKMLKILKQNMHQIIQLVKDGSFTLEEVKTAYFMRALDIAVENNYLAELYIQDKQAHRIRENKPKLRTDHLLYGVTYSAADWIDMNGYDSSCGIASRALKPETEDAVIIKALNDLQAVPIFRSSVNQGAGSIDSCFAKENANSIWGRALNPHKKEVGTGGSCGGEAGLVSTFSVGIGFAVDLYGDARYPAACCGVCAFKPTSGRISSQGISKCNMISPISNPVVTPIARSAKDLTHLFKCLWDSQVQSQYDSNVIPMKFKHDAIKEGQKLHIGYYLSDGLINPSQANKQALLIVKQALEEQGHTLIEFQMGQSISDGVLLAYQILCSSGKLQEYTNALQGEQPIEEMLKLFQQATLSNVFKTKLISILKQLRQERMAIVMESTKQIHPLQQIELMNKLNQFIRYFTEYWISMSFDVVISPAGVLPAIPHKLSGELFSLNSNFMLYNLLDYPAGVIPIKLVQQEDIKEAQIHQTRSKTQQSDRISEFMRLAQLDSQGLPVGVQVAALPNQDEKCLQLMETIEKIIGFNELSLAYIY